MHTQVWRWVNVAVSRQVDVHARVRAGGEVEAALVAQGLPLSEREDRRQTHRTRRRPERILRAIKLVFQHLTL